MIVRKANKLPGKKLKAIYKKEYGEDIFEIAQGSIRPESKVILVDDLIATGGTLNAASQLVKESAAQVI